MSKTYRDIKTSRAKRTARWKTRNRWHAPKLTEKQAELVYLKSVEESWR